MAELVRRSRLTELGLGAMLTGDSPRSAAVPISEKMGIVEIRRRKKASKDALEAKRAQEEAEELEESHAPQPETERTHVFSLCLDPQDLKAELPIEEAVTAVCRDSRLAAETAAKLVEGVLGKPDSSLKYGQPQFYKADEEGGWWTVSVTGNPAAIAILEEGIASAVNEYGNPVTHASNPQQVRARQRVYNSANRMRLRAARVPGMGNYPTHIRRLMRIGKPSPRPASPVAAPRRRPLGSPPKPAAPRRPPRSPMSPALAAQRRRLLGAQVGALPRPPHEDYMREASQLVEEFGGVEATKFILGCQELEDSGTKFVETLAGMFESSDVHEAGSGLNSSEPDPDADSYPEDDDNADPLGGIAKEDPESEGDVGMYYMTLDIPLQDYMDQTEGDLEAAKGAAAVDGEAVRQSAYVIAARVNGGSIPEDADLGDPVFGQYNADNPGWQSSALWAVPISGPANWLEPFVVQYAREELGLPEDEAQDEIHEIEYGQGEDEDDDGDNELPADDERRDGRYTYDDMDDEQGD